MMAAGCIRRGFRWELDGLGGALRPATKANRRATKNSISSAISDMPGVVPAYPRIALLMRFDFRWRATAEIGSYSFAYSNYPIAQPGTAIWNTTAPAVNGSFHILMPAFSRWRSAIWSRTC